MVFSLLWYYSLRFASFLMAAMKHDRLGWTPCPKPVSHNDNSIILPSFCAEIEWLCVTFMALFRLRHPLLEIDQNYNREKPTCAAPIYSIGFVIVPPGP